MRYNTLIFLGICGILLLFIGCSEEPSSDEVSKYQQHADDWDASLGCLEEAASAIDELYDQWDELYQLLPVVYPDLPAASELSFEQVETQVQDCRDIFYRSLSELRIIETVRTEFASDIRTLKEVLETGEWDRIDPVRFQLVVEMTDFKETCERYRKELMENTPECQALYDAYLATKEQ